MKVKEPQPAEFALLRPGQILFTYLHLAADQGPDRGADRSPASRASPTKPSRSTAACRCSSR